MIYKYNTLLFNTMNLLSPRVKASAEAEIPNGGLCANLLFYNISYSILESARKRISEVTRTH